MNYKVEKSVYEFWKTVPKCEMHAHLNGSVRPSTLREFLGEDEVQDFDSILENSDLSSCFRIFDFIHKAITTHERLYRITKEMIEDFHRDKCIALEIRTTPKELDGKSLDDYVRTVVKAIKETVSELKGEISVSLLLSINRATADSETTEKIIQLALANQGIVRGLDFSGNPFKNKFKDFYDALQRAKEKGLKVTLHFSEKKDDEEDKLMLDFGPDRIGHVNYISKENRKRLLDLRIPIEICISSNVATRSVKSVEDHHLGYYVQNNHPVVLCTDDPLIFHTDLTREYCLAEEWVRGVSREDLLKICKESPNLLF